MSEKGSICSQIKVPFCILMHKWRVKIETQKQSLCFCWKSSAFPGWTTHVQSFLRIKTHYFTMHALGYHRWGSFQPCGGDVQQRRPWLGVKVGVHPGWKVRHLPNWKRTIRQQSEIVCFILQMFDQRLVPVLLKLTNMSSLSVCPSVVPLSSLTIQGDRWPIAESTDATWFSESFPGVHEQVSCGSNTSQWNPFHIIHTLLKLWSYGSNLLGVWNSFWNEWF